MAKIKMKDIQNQLDNRKIVIDKVGIKDVKYPITVLDRANGFQNTIASVNMYVELPHQFRGTHMSRFIAILNEHRGEITMRNIGTILDDMMKRLDAEAAHLEIEFPYFIEKTAPISKEKSLLCYTCRFLASMNDIEDFILEVQVPVITLCPCSKEISDYGAHNQRSLVVLQVRFKEFLWIEDLISLIESCASGEIFALLEPEDEKYIIEHTYNNPRFVEDVVREIVIKLEKDTNIIWYYVSSENFESIHNHSAYALVEKKV